MPRISRRRYVRLGVPLIAFFAGCAESQPAPTADGEGTNTADGSSPVQTGSESTTSDTSATETQTKTTAASTAAENTTTEPSGELDLREANVVGVAVEERSGGYRFDVTLIHDVHGSKALVSKPERRAFWLRRRRRRLRELVTGRVTRE